MKKILLIFILITCLVSCENEERDFPDFDYVSGFFPYQFPVRTIILGDYIYDNENDNNHLFVISVAMGGVYDNKKDRKFDIEIDESLCEKVLFKSSKDTIRIMPQDYFRLESNQIVIPKGKYNGGVKVHLTEKFFADTNSIKNTYVVPIRLVGSNDVDTILSGKTGMPNADPRFSNYWEIAPKNFTMFGVKYMNEYQGNYFHFGKSIVKNSIGTEIENSTYEEKYMEKNPIVNIKTKERHQASFKIKMKSSYLDKEVEMYLKFDGDKCSVVGDPKSALTISGEGEFKKDAFVWGNKPRNGIVVNYTISDGEYTYTAQDTFVVRDREVVLEVFEPEAHL